MLAQARAWQPAQLRSPLSFLQQIDYYPGGSQALLAERRRKLAAAKELRKQAGEHEGAITPDPLGGRPNRMLFSGGDSLTLIGRDHATTSQT